jgi:hypothetical protein
LCASDDRPAPKVAHSVGREEGTERVEAALDIPRLVGMGTTGATLETFSFPTAPP